MEKKPIDMMVDRFLGWKLPADFAPDGGISFKRDFNEHTAYPMKNEPIGTNLLTAIQAKEMLEYVLDGGGATEVKMFTADEVAEAVVTGNKVMVDMLEELCTRVANAEYQRDKSVTDLLAWKEFAVKMSLPCEPTISRSSTTGKVEVVLLAP